MNKPTSTRLSMIKAMPSGYCSLDIETEVVKKHFRPARTFSYTKYMNYVLKHSLRDLSSFRTISGLAPL